jgi:hypothetical protein
MFISKENQRLLKLTNKLAFENHKKIKKLILETNDAYEDLAASLEKDGDYTDRVASHFGDCFDRLQELTDIMVRERMTFRTLLKFLNR